MGPVKLYSRWRNSAGERVRIALNLKRMDYTYVPASSLPPGEYRRINPQGLLPTLEADGRFIAQSGAILEYLEETHPDPPLLPAEPVLRAQARAFGAHIAAEMHALTVDRVRKYLGAAFGADDAGVARWIGHWLTAGFTALEATLAGRPTDWPFCFGAAPGWADLHLVPQIGNAHRFDVGLSPYPLILGIMGRCAALPAFQKARPEAQVDYPEGQADTG